MGERGGEEEGKDHWEEETRCMPLPRFHQRLALTHQRRLALEKHALLCSVSLNLLPQALQAIRDAAQQAL